MLRSAKGLKGFTVRGTDGDVGRIDDFYFDDDKWTIRYIVVSTGGWPGRRVLVSPVSFSATDWEGGAIDLSLTRDRIRNSPDADLNTPITREYERGYSAYYGYRPYWAGPGYWGMGTYPAALYSPDVVRADRAQGSATGVEELPETRVYGSMAVLGYHIQATDGGIGHVDDLVFDDESWAILYLRIDTSNWIGGKAVLVPKQSLLRVDAVAAQVHVNLTRDQVQRSPRYDRGALNREEGETLDAYYRYRR